MSAPNTVPMNFGILHVLLLALGCFCVSGQLAVRHSWKSPDFVFPNEEAKQALIADGSYEPNTGFMLDVDRDRRGRTFVTLPRFDNGTTVTLATVFNERQYDSPPLKPYPSWDWHKDGNCDGLVSIFRIKIDQCNRLWALDSGVVDVFGTYTQACPPKLMVFDLNRDVLIKKYVFPEGVVEPGSLLITIEVETGYRCQGTYAYIADVVGYNLIVYNFDRDRSWSVNSSAFYPDPNYSMFDIAGSQFELSDGLFALTLSPPVKVDGHILYFHSLASNCESSVGTRWLKDEDIFASDPNAIEDKIRKCFRSRRGQSAAEAMDSSGNVFSSDLSENAINCWNWQSKTTKETRVAKSDRFLQFISGMKIVHSYNGDELWAITPRFQKVMTTGLNRSEYNFHIVCGSAEALAKSGGCQPPWVWS